MPPLYWRMHVGINQRGKEDRSFQHDLIVVVARIAISLPWDIHHLTDNLVVTGSEQVECLVLKLLLNVTQRMFSVDKTANEE